MAPTAKTAKLAASFERNFIFASFDLVERTFDFPPETRPATAYKGKLSRARLNLRSGGHVSDLANI
jgi:hypothetical protein